MKANTGQEPAFPAMDMNSHMGVDRMELRYVGLTKREYFAAKAMEALIGQMDRYDGEGNYFTTSICKDAVNFADELLKALEQ